MKKIEFISPYKSEINNRCLYPFSACAPPGNLYDYTIRQESMFDMGWVRHAGTGRIELFLIYAVGTCSFLAHEDDRWWFLCLRLFAV